MTAIDFAILAVMLISALFAFRRGITRETVSIFAWVGTGLATYYAFPWIRPLAHASIPFGMVADVVALFVVFFGFLMLFGSLTSRLAGLVVSSKPGITERSMGFAFGLGRGLVLVAGGFWLMGFSDRDQEPPSYVVEANLFPLVDATAQSLAAFLPQGGALAAQGRARALAYTSDPTYETPDGSADEDGYADSERRALDQLIESTSGD